MFTLKAGMRLIFHMSDSCLVAILSKTPAGVTPKEINKTESPPSSVSNVNDCNPNQAMRVMLLSGETKYDEIREFKILILVENMGLSLIDDVLF